MDWNIERKSRRQEDKLGQYSRLIPSDVLVVQAVSSDIDYRCKRNF